MTTLASVPPEPVAPEPSAPGPIAAGSLPAPQHQREDIQGLRAVAMLMVAAYHVGAPLPGAFTGPDVFFVVSGFVITGMLLREQATTGAVSLLRFYGRRIRRLLPALALFTIVTLALAVLLLPPIGQRQQVTGLAARAATTITANLYFLRETGGYFQPAAQENPFLHTWTLSVEEQFYLVFPLALALLWRLARGRHVASRWIIAIVATMFAASFAINVALTYEWLPPWPRLAARIAALGPVRIAFFSPVTRAWEFLAGVLIALAAARWMVPGRLQRWMALVGAVLLVVTQFAVTSTGAFPGVLVLLPVLGAACVLIGGLGGPGVAPSLITRALSTRPMVWIGDRSYSWYLWHWPLIVYARTFFVLSPIAPVVAALVALVPAALSFRFVEEPIRRRRVWPSPPATAGIAAACVVMPLVCAIGLTTAAERAWGDPDLAAVRESIAPNHIDITAVCASFTPLGDSIRAKCIWPAKSSRGVMLLIGDSNAGHLSEPFIAAANALGYDAQLATAGGCPFLLRPTYLSEQCRTFVEGSTKAIAARAPAYAAVVVSNASVGYLGGPLAPQFVPDASPAGATDRAGAIRGWTASVTRTVDALSPHAPVIVVGGVPQFYNLPGCLRPTLFSKPSPACGKWEPWMARLHRADIITSERTAVLAHGGTYLDTADKLCNAQGCSAFIDGKLIYRDGAHLSVSGSMHFQPDFEAALSAAIRSRAAH